MSVQVVPSDANTFCRRIFHTWKALCHSFSGMELKYSLMAMSISSSDVKRGPGRFFLGHLRRPSDKADL